MAGARPARQRQADLEVRDSPHGARADVNQWADTVAIRQFQPGDAAAVREMFIRVNRDLAPPNMRQAFESYVERSLAEEIGRIAEYYDDRRGSTFWVAIDGDDLAGMFGLEKLDHRRVEIRRMYVSPDHRRRGLAQKMLETAERIAGAAGYREIEASTSEIQDAALSLYRRSGYELRSERVAKEQSNRTVGGNIRRFHFSKVLGG